MAAASSAGSPPFGTSFTKVTGRTRRALSASRAAFSRRDAACAPPSTKSNTRPLESSKTTAGSTRTPCSAARNRLPPSSQSFTEGRLGTVTNCTSRTCSSSARRSSVPGRSAFSQRASAAPGSAEPYTTSTGGGGEGAAAQEAGESSASARPGTAVTSARQTDAITAATFMKTAGFRRAGW